MVSSKTKLRFPIAGQQGHGSRNTQRGEDKPHRVAVTHVAKKLVRVIYALERQGVDFNAHKLSIPELFEPLFR